MRKAITLFDDQYNFYKELKSENLLIAFVEFMFEDKQPKNNQLNNLETTIFNSLVDRMEKWKKTYDRNSKGGSSSRGGGRPRKYNQDLEGKNSLKTTKETTKKQPKNKEEEVEEYSIYSYEYIFENYYGISKGFDEKKCNKLMDTKLKQGFTLDVIKKRMVLYNCECRLKQEWTYVKVLETWLTKLQPITDDQMDEELRNIARAYKEKTNTNPKFIDSDVAKIIRSDLCSEFGQGKITEIRKSEGRKQINLLLK